MLGRCVSQHTIALLKLWQNARRFGPENPPTGRTTTVREFINHFLHFDRLDLRDAAASKVETPEWHLTIRTGVFGVDRDHLIGLLFIKRGAAVTAPALPQARDVQPGRHRCCVRLWC